MAYIIGGIPRNPHSTADTPHILLDQTPPVDHTAGEGSRVIAGVAGVAGVVFPNMVVLNPSAKWILADAGNSTGVGFIGMALTTAVASTSTFTVLLDGFVRDDTWNWTDGGIAGQVYVSTTAGGLTQTAPSATGDQIQVVGYAHTGDVLYFKPSRDVIEISVK